ncbi:MAG: outer membrane beta-barrel protein, partial [Verrucomicrobiales bacterium]|nr:outer membrane beta-barrel protein [Verrucomicrobiales bacterium]
MKNMKMNKWTMGLAAAGVVSLSSVAQAQDAAAGAEALAASTTLSGYVSTGYKFNNGNAGAGYFRAAEDRNAFSLDVVDLKLSSAQGDGAQDTGYTVELWMGPAATDIGTQDSGANVGTVELMQANIDLRLNGIDLKVGQFGTVVGNEVYNYNENAFYTHSWGFSIEPTHHTGILASYTVSDDLQISAGLANSTGNAINGSQTGSTKTYLASVSYTLPSGTGPLAGTELYYGLVSGNADGASGDNTDYHYSSIALPELVANLTTKVVW